MAGMLPGVETARRRRLRSSSVIASGFGSISSRLSHDTHFIDTLFLQRNQSDDEDDKLGGAAKEAKERLNGRLRGHLKSEIRRQNSQERVGGVWRRSNATTTSMVMQDLRMEVFGLKKSGSKRFGWGRIGSSWKSSNQDECAICLDQFKAGETVTHLPCAHRFHSDCVCPWLEDNAQCPCCRRTVLGSN
ncbi:probable E3 ubiquitin-protein ligase RHY1A [Cynara cardunculus var. scolymus]|uniref:probable E3 ubiquitin-protein ligase RHY1A n=1 Tax=Cynara cardunculus var. scolymus TaxID=59895 RepID=UPI000D62E884|nr:probable E3 ubiquitin-protein ligase RHY1A [Cynara cardunculus var. scolymus]